MRSHGRSSTIRKLTVAAFAGAGVLLGPGFVGGERAARAQGNYRSTPLGGRSALMGGTGVAAGRDGAAPFLNPATITNVDDTGFAFSANFLQIRSISIRDFHKPGAVTENEFGKLELDRTDLTVTEVDLIPSTLCLFVNLSGKTEDNSPRHRASFCFGTLERDAQSKLAIGYRGGSSAARVDQGQSFLRKWSRFSIGPAYSVNLTEELSVGASVSALSTNFDELSSGNTSIYSSSGRFLATAIDNVTSAASVDLTAALGITYKLDRHYKLGLSASVPSLHILGNYSSIYQTQYSGRDDFAYANRGEGSFRASTPAKVAVGLAGSLPKVRFEIDATLHLPRAKATEAKLAVEQFASVSGTTAERNFDATFSTDTQAVLNSGVGIEWLFRPRLGLLAGLSTDFTSLPPLSRLPEVGTTAFARMNRASASIGLGSYGDNAELVVGVEGSYGWGKTFVLNPFELPNRYVPIDQRAWGFMLVVAGATNLNALRATVENVNNIVKTPGKK